MSHIKKIRYSIKPRGGIFVKYYGQISFAKNMSKNIDKKIRKCFRSKYSQKLIDHVKESTTDASKTASKGAFHKLAESSDDLICNKIVDIIIKVSRILPLSNLDTVDS